MIHTNASTLFLEFLAMNDLLIKDGKLLISNEAMVSVALLIAESKPEEKDIMISLTMNILSLNK
ncbi:MAG: phosphoribosylaminoimidazolesuccinocarboxamide synthase [Bacilli bacterium]|nr:phosphoribosylaminoimidazolesuccinocarboxamide synthase [Bacilli bacterium]